MARSGTGLAQGAGGTIATCVHPDIVLARARRDHLVYLEDPAGHLGLCLVECFGLILIGLHERLDVGAAQVKDTHVRECFLHLVAPQPDALTIGTMR